MTKLQFKLNKHSMLIWVGLLSLMIFGFMSFYPTMADQGMQDLLEGMSDSMLQILGFDTFPDFSKIDQFYGYIIQYINIAIVVFAVTLGLNTYLKEERDGTIEFLFNQPLTRTQLIVQKFIGNILILGSILLAVIIVSCISIAIFVPTDANLNSILLSTIPVFGMLILSTFIFLLLGTGLSLILSSDLSVTGIAMGIVFVPYVLGMMAQMIEPVKRFEFISILHTTMPDRIYSGTFNSNSIILWLVLAGTTFIYGMIHFQKRDIKS